MESIMERVTELQKKAEAFDNWSSVREEAMTDRPYAAPITGDDAKGRTVTACDDVYCWHWRPVGCCVRHCCSHSSGLIKCAKFRHNFEDLHFLLLNSHVTVRSVGPVHISILNLNGC